MNRLSLWILLLFLAVGVSGCDLVGDVLEFGFWLIVIIIGLIAALGYWLYGKLRGRR